MLYWSHCHCSLLSSAAAARIASFHTLSRCCVIFKGGMNESERIASLHVPTHTPPQRHLFPQSGTKHLCTSTPSSTSASAAVGLVEPFPNSPLQPQAISHSTSSPALRDADSQPSLLVHSIDRFGGVVIDPLALPESVVEFELRLSLSLQQWSKDKRRGIWCQISISLAELIVVAARLGFVFHHAQEQFVMMTLWLPKWTQQNCKNDINNNAEPVSPNPLPNYHSHSLGVGVFVLNDRGQCLTVVEKYSPIPNFVKLPGGAVDPGENLSVAAVREVKEETGINCLFHSILGFRHLLRFRFGGGDIYFVSVATCQNSGSQTLVAQASEILKCEWMDVADFLELDSAGWFANIIRGPLLAEMEALQHDGFLKQWPEESQQKLALDTPVSPSTSFAVPQSDLSAYTELSESCMKSLVAGIGIKIVTRSSTGESSFFYIVNSRANANRSHL